MEGMSYNAYNFYCADCTPPPGKENSQPSHPPVSSPQPSPFQVGQKIKGVSASITPVPTGGASNLPSADSSPAMPIRKRY